MKTFLLACGTFVLAAAAPTVVSAQVLRETSFQEFAIVNEEAFNVCTGERLIVNALAQFRSVRIFQLDQNGVPTGFATIEQHGNVQGLQAVTDDGVVYHGSGVDQITFHQAGFDVPNVPVAGHSISSSILVGPGPSNNVRVFSLFVLVINAQGDMTVEFSKIEFECGK